MSIQVDAAVKRMAKANLPSSSPTGESSVPESPEPESGATSSVPKDLPAPQALRYGRGRGSEPRESVNTNPGPGRGRGALP